MGAHPQTASGAPLQQGSAGYQTSAGSQFRPPSLDAAPSASQPGTPASGPTLLPTPVSHSPKANVPPPLPAPVAHSPKANVPPPPRGPPPDESPLPAGPSPGPP